MSGDDLSPATDDHLVHVALYQYVAVPVGHRHRVVVGPVPDQGQRTHPACLLVAGIIGYRAAGAAGRPGPAPSADRWSPYVP